MRWTNPLTRRTMPLKAADDRIHLWAVIQFTLLAWGVGLLAEPYFPAIFTRPFGAAALAPFNLLPHWGLALVMFAGGGAVAASCWLVVRDTVSHGLRLVGMALLLTLFVSYLLSGFPYATLQFGVLIGWVGVSYLYMPTEC